MRKDLIITMSLSDRKKYEKNLKLLHEYLMEQGYKLDGDERQEMWARTRMLKDVMEVFKED